MIALTISILVMLYLLDRLRIEKLETAKTQGRFSLYRVRDELRRRACSGEIPFDEWFAYMDTTLSRTIHEIDNVSVWHGLSYMVAYRDDDRMQRARHRLLEELKHNKSLAEIDEAYLQCIREILKSRHAFFWSWLSRTFSAVSFISQTKRRIVYMFASAPETSTLLNHAV